MSPAAAGPTVADRLDPDELAALDEQRDFLLRSLEDLEREHDAGDLTEADYHTLKDDYTARAAETLRAIEDQRLAFASAQRPRSRKRTVLTLAAVVLFAAVAGALVASSLGARKAGDTITGGITTKSSPSQQAQLCIPKITTAPVQALKCLDAVLEQDPRNVVALTWKSWAFELTSSQLPADLSKGMQARASASIEAAVAADPDYSYARAFRAVIAFRHGEYAKAKQYLADFEARDPSPEAKAVIESFDLKGQIAKALANPTTTTTPGG